MILRWTEKQPAEIGWYWLMEITGSEVIESIVYIKKYVGQLCIINWPIPISIPLKKVFWAACIAP